MELTAIKGDGNVVAKRIRFVHMGFGPMGAMVCKLACEKNGLELVAALEMVNLGKDVGEVVNLGKKLGVLLSNDVNATLAKKPDILVNTTMSSLARVKDQLIPFIKAGVNVVSTCEELSYPWETAPKIATELDTLAKRHKVTVLGTGVNPGFTMDTFPIVMTGVSQKVEHIEVARIQDGGSRRLPFQKKIGAGCTPAEFADLKKKGTVRHVGLRQSADMIAAAIGWKIDEYSETIDPIIAKTSVSSGFITVRVGQVAGVEQIAIARMKSKEIIKMVFQAYLGAPESYDAVRLTGVPSMEVVIKGGTPGDIATASMAVNAIPRVVNAPPGLITMKDLPPVHVYSGNYGALVS